MNKISIGKKIKHLREEMGLTQEKLASLLHLSSQSISKWENETAVPAVDTLVELSNIFNISLDELLAERTFKDRIFEANMRDIYNHSKKGFNVNKEIENFTFLLIPEKKSENPYWENSARSILQGTLLAMLEDKTMSLLKFNLETIKELFQFGEERKNNNKIKDYFKNKSLRSKQLADQLLNTPFNTANCIIAVLIDAINK